MLNQRPQILQIAAVSIMCLALAAGVGAQGSVESSDSLPLIGAEYVARSPSTYAVTVEVEILSMSLRAQGQTVSPTTLLPGEYQIDSFFDVLCELSVDGVLHPNVYLGGPATLRIVVPDSPDTTWRFETEILSMDLTGDVSGVGGLRIDIRLSESQPSLGMHIPYLDGSRWLVDSFFYVFTELSVGGGPFIPSDGPTPMETQLGQVESSDAFPIQGGMYVAHGPTYYAWTFQTEIVSMSLTSIDPSGRLSLTTLSAGRWEVDSFFDVFTELSVDGGPLSPVLLSGPAVLRVVVPDDAFDNRTGTFATEIVSMDLSGGGAVGEIMLRESPATRSPGVHTLTDLGGGLYEVDSFFDIFTELSINGGPFAPADGPTRLALNPPDIEPRSSFEQLDWEGPFDPTPDSAWGRVQTQYDKPAGIHYYNLAVDTQGTGVLTWVVMNRSIETPGGPQTLSTYFDLGIEAGQDVPSLDYVSSLDSSPLALSSGGPAGTVQSALVGNLRFQVGTDSAPGTLGAPGKPAPDPKPAGVKDVAQSGVLPNLDKFVNQPQGKNQCAPGAISNSLKYLQATGKISNTLPTDISDVGAVIGTDKNGTDAGWPTKKKEHYKKHVTTRFIEAPLDASEIQDLIDQLKDGQDIEMDLVGHVEVLAGLRWKKDGTVDFDLFDDNQTDDESDPMHTSPLMTDGTNDKVDGMILQRFVVECPVKKTTTCVPSFSLNTYMDWTIGLEGHECGHIIPMLPDEWATYWELWQNPEFTENDQAYPQTEFQTPQLYVYEGDGDPANEWPDDAGLVMAWGNPDISIGGSSQQASALKYKYGVDPDLSNSIITVVVTAPQFGPNGQINQVSLGLETPGPGGISTGLIRSWYWNCGNAATDPIKWGVPTTIKIDTSMIGTAAATPTATNFLDAPGFDITNVQWIIVDENGTWVGGATPAPGPGGAPVFMWNYWHWLMVSPKTTLSKGYYTKWSQGPVVLDTGDPPLFWGWDEPSDYYQGPVVADDWLCEDDRPISDFHWWGSFPGWKEPYPPCQPKAFHLGIWTDVPAIAGDPESYSHPGELVWSHLCDNYVWNFAGYDRDPRNFPAGSDPGGGIPGDDPTFEPTDSCFQYNQLLSQEDWFYQDSADDAGRVYWLSIAPIWDQTCDYKWGWKSRPHFFQDNAVIIREVFNVSADGTVTPTWPPTIGSMWLEGHPIEYPTGRSWDVTFELTTNEPGYKDNPLPGDLNLDGSVNFSDLVIMAGNWGVTVLAVP